MSLHANELSREEIYPSICFPRPSVYQLINRVGDLEKDFKIVQNGKEKENQLLV
jgi:hypothetical protein